MNIKNVSVLFHNSMFLVGADKDITVLLKEISLTNIVTLVFYFLSPLVQIRK